MPLTSKGEEIKANMEQEYGSKEGERVFYASKNAGTIKGVDAAPCAADATLDNIEASRDYSLPPPIWMKCEK
jgi:hypothetical protein